MRHWSVNLVLLMVLAGCRVEIEVPEGGSVASASGLNGCPEARLCEVDVEDVGFVDTFTARPNTGYLFAGWLREPNGPCGGSLMPCVLDAGVAPDCPAVIALLESDELYFLTPQFLPERDVWRYVAGNSVHFRGSLSLSDENGASQEHPVLGRLAIRATTREHNGFPVLLGELRVSSLDGEALYTWTSTFWQDERGALLVLEDDSGNLLLNTGDNVDGITLVPAPLEPLADYDIPFAIMWGGHTSTPLTSGARQISVGEEQIASLPMGETAAYELHIMDRYTYLVTYGEFRSGQSVETQQVVLLSPAKVIAGLAVEQRVKSATGKLLRSMTLDLELTRANF